MNAKSVRSYRDLVAWQKSVDLVAEAYLLTECLPRTQVFGLASQLQRAAVSVPANIAEGNGRRHRGEYLRYLSIARGSLNEVEALIHVCLRLTYIQQEAAAHALTLCDEVSRLLTALTRSLSEGVSRVPRPSSLVPRF